MSTIYFKLAALNLACVSEDIHLTATASLEFVCSDTAVHCFSPQQLSKALRAAELVVKRGQGCRIDVDVDCDGITTQEALLIEDLKETLGMAICEAPWWSQLPICPVLQQLPECFRDEKIPFSITLTDTLPDFLLEDNNNETSNTQDVKIPNGIPILQVQRIAIDLQFQGLIERMPDEQEVDEDAMDTSFEGIFDDQHDPHELPTDGEQHYVERQDSFPEEEETWTCHLAPISSFELDYSFLIEDESKSTSSLAPDVSPFSSQESAFTDITCLNDLVKEGRTGPAVPAVTMEVNLAHLLTDVAMRTLIGGGQSTSTDGVTLVRPLPKHTFSALMPLLFSPQFSSSMSQRSRFLPTITSAVNMLGISAQSPCLKSKLAQLRDRGQPMDRPSLAGAVHAQTYRIMHTSLFSAKAARCLPVNKLAGGAEEDSHEDSMIIDRSAVSLEKAGSVKRLPTKDMLDIDFEEMLEDEPLPEDEIDMLLDMEILRQGLSSTNSILLSNPGDERRGQDAASMIDLDMKEVEEEMMEAKDDSMIEISEKSYIAQDTERDLPSCHVDMLF